MSAVAFDTLTAARDLEAPASSADKPKPPPAGCRSRLKGDGDHQETEGHTMSAAAFDRSGPR